MKRVNRLTIAFVLEDDMRFPPSRWLWGTWNPLDFFEDFAEISIVLSGSQGDFFVSLLTRRGEKVPDVENRGSHPPRRGASPVVASRGPLGLA
jgi:hypothetical protein